MSDDELRWLLDQAGLPWRKVDKLVTHRRHPVARAMIQAALTPRQEAE